MLLTVQVVASLGRPLVPWSIIELNDEDITFAQLFQRIQAGSFGVIVVSNDVMRAQISRTFLGPKWFEVFLCQQQSSKIHNNLILNNHPRSNYIQSWTGNKDITTNGFSDCHCVSLSSVGSQHFTLIRVD